MKAVGIILIILCVIALGGIGFMYFNSSVDVSFVRCEVTDPQADPDYFALLKRQVEQGSFPGVRFTDELLTRPEDYEFKTWTLKVTNNTFQTAKAVEIQVTSMSDDILLIPDEAEHVIKSKSSEYITVTFLSRRNAHNVREATVTWYLGGIQFPNPPMSVTIGK